MYDDNGVEEKGMLSYEKKAIGGFVQAL